MTVLTSLTLATERRKQAQADWELAVKRAAREHSYRQVAPVAGVSYGRVAQIVAKPVQEVSWYHHA